MKTTRFACLILVLLAGRGESREQFRTDINPALQYFQAFLLTPELSPDDRDYLFNKEWRGQQLPPRFGDLVGKYDNQFKLVRQAAHSTVPCDWGVDMTPGPGTLLPGLARNKGIAVTARLRAMWDLQQGRPEAARDDLLAAFTLARRSSTDGILISVLVQIAMENIICTTVADNFYRFPAETLKQLWDGFDSAPARGTVAASLPREKTVFVDWMLERVQDLRKANPGNDLKVMEGIHESCFQEAKEDGQPDANLWQRVLTASGRTSDGVIRLIQDAVPLFPTLEKILALPPGQSEEELKKFSAEVHRSTNPIVSLTFPSFEKCRPKESGVLVRLAMVQAAVKYKSHGEAGLRTVMDPGGQGAFDFQRFVFQGADRGFKLTSPYAGLGMPCALIFVEKAGPLFYIDGPHIGQAAQP